MKQIIPNQNLKALKTPRADYFFLTNSHYAPKFFKVVANSKKVGRHFQRQTKPFFTLSQSKIDPPKLN